MTMKNLLLTIALIFISHSLFANPINTTPFKVIQPNGDSITIVKKGDEYCSWYETLDGYIVNKNSSNYWVYVTKDTNNKLVLTDQIVGNTSSPIDIHLVDITTVH